VTMWSRKGQRVEWYTSTKVITHATNRLRSERCVDEHAACRSPSVLVTR
jgi:hypothetical protein